MVITTGLTPRRYNRLYNRLYNRRYNRLYNRLYNRYYKEIRSPYTTTTTYMTDEGCVSRLTKVRTAPVCAKLAEIANDARER